MPRIGDVFDGTDSKAARRTCPSALWNVARRKLDQLNQADRLDDLRVPPANLDGATRGPKMSRSSITTDGRS